MGFPPLPLPGKVNQPFDVGRESAIKRHAEELEKRVRMLEALLAPFHQVFFDAADGQRLAVLAMPAGTATHTCTDTSASSGGGGGGP